jgi:hypothetical protein
MRRSGGNRKPCKKILLVKPYPCAGTDSVRRAVAGRSPVAIMFRQFVVRRNGTARPDAAPIVRIEDQRED